MGYRAGRFGGRPAGPVVIRVPGEAILTAERDATLLPVTGGRSLTAPVNFAASLRQRGHICRNSPRDR